MFHVPNDFRIRTGKLQSDNSYGNNGAFNVYLKEKECGYYCQCIASDGEGWEHVSMTICNANVQGLTFTPSWKEMCFIKDIFWDAEDCVVQFHPPKSEYINNHKNVLHLWRPTGYNIMTPPSIMIGIKSKKK